MAYLQNGLAVPYHGRWTKSALTKFITSLMRPIHRITTTEGLLDLMLIHDAVIVAFIDVNQHRKHYKIFYQTAVKWLERDPYQNVVFAIVTGETAQQFGVVDRDDNPFIRAYLWNGTIEYEPTSTTSWTQATLHQWVDAQSQQTVAQWLSPPGSKANTLAPFLKRGPALLLFTPRNMQTDSIDAYTMLRQIGLEYFNCPPGPNTEWIKEVSRAYLPELRQSKRIKFNAFLDDCQQLFAVNNGNTDGLCFGRAIRSRPDSSITFGNIVNSSKLSSDSCPIGLAAAASSGRRCHNERNEQRFSCLDGETHSTSSSSCDGDQINDDLRPAISIVKTVYDNRSPTNLMRIARRKQCERHYSSRMLRHDAAGDTIFLGVNTDRQRNDKIFGLACKTNRTLSLLAMDSLLYHTFADRLGVDVLLRPNKTVVYIVDHAMESTYTLLDVSSDGLIDFVHNFTTNNLTRYLKTTLPKGAAAATVKRRGHEVKANRTNGPIRIREIDSSEFVAEVLQSNKVLKKN